LNDKTTTDLVAQLRGWQEARIDLAVKRVTANAADEIERLRAALVHSVSVVQTWHNMEIPQKQRSELWDIYWRNAPEMKPIREALRGNAA